MELCEGSKVYKFRDMCASLNVRRDCWSVISVYAPGMERTGSEIKHFYG